MSYGIEQRATQHPQGKSPHYWIDGYLRDLAEKGWRYITSPREGKINPSLLAAQDEGTVSLLNKWRETQKPVEISMVLVMPNTGIEDLPTRALGYIGTTLSLTRSLRERDHINISSLRILSPCYWNIYANGGNIDRQIVNSTRAKELAQTYKEQYYPELDQVGITVDTGKPITPEVEAALLPRVLLIQRGYPSIVEELQRVAIRHDGNGTVDHSPEESMRPLAYLLAHPPAWGFSLEPELFDVNGNRRINFVPASELRYLAYMAATCNDAWTPDPDAQISTLISGKQTRAPYYPVRLAVIDRELTIRDLLAVGAIQRYKSLLSKANGRIEIAETIANLNQLQSDTEQSRRRKPIHETIARVIN